MNDRMKVKIILLPILTLLVVGCTNNSTPSPTPSGDEVSFTIDFSEAPQTNSSSGNFESKFLPLFTYEDVNYVSDFEFEGYSQINESKLTDESGENKFVSLIIGSASTEGILSFTFTKPLKKATFDATPRYSAYFDYASQSYVKRCDDLRSAITVNTEEWVLRDSENENFDRVNKEFSVNSTNFSISAYAKERVWIHSLTLTF